MKIFIDICNAAKIMVLGKGSSLAVSRGRGFISIIKSSAPSSRVSRDSSSYYTTLQAKSAWARSKA